MKLNINQLRRAHLPSSKDGVYDLSQAVISLNVDIAVEENETVSGVGIYPMDLEWVDNGVNPMLPNVCLVKNGLIRNSQNGMIENIRRIDQLQSILQHFNSSSLEKYSRSDHSVTQMLGQSNAEQYSIYRDINKLGTIKSKQNRIAPVQIPLRDIFDFAHQATELDTTKTGTMTISLELNIDKLDPVQRMESANVEAEVLEFKPVSTEGDVNTITTEATFTDLNQSFYYVGQKLSMTGTDSGGASVGPSEAVINEIVWNADETLTISFENKWATNAASVTLSAIKAETEGINSATVSFDFGEITLMKLAKTSSDVREIEYSTFSTDETTNAPQQSYQRLFQVEADCDAVIAAFPVNGSISSSDDSVTKYRVRVDNQDLTDRDVEPESPLAYDRTNMTMSQMSLRLKNLETSRAVNTAGESFRDSQSSADTVQMVIMNPVSQTIREKQLQLNLTAASPGVSAVTLFKHRPRQLKL